jgi:hypothetical protein
MPQLLHAVPKRGPAPLMWYDDVGAERLLRFNIDLLDQAVSLVQAHEHAGAPAFGDYAGAHLRHVIEHYEALLLRPDADVIDYDNRPRDRELERCAQSARARLQRLQQSLRAWPAATLETPIRVSSRIGVAGEIEFETRSSVGRELVFLASHAVHHFALLQVYCHEHGLSMGSRFGVAPATLAHRLQA